MYFCYRISNKISTLFTVSYILNGIYACFGILNCHSMVCVINNTLIYSSDVFNSVKRKQ